MTGKHGYTTGLTENNPKLRPMAEHRTLPGVLTRHGYQTRAQGKMHFSPTRAHYGFEYMELPMDYYRERNRNERDGLPKAHGLGENEMEPVISTVDETNCLTYWIVRRSIDFLETRDETRPFFLWTSFTKPHPPFDPCANYWNLYRDREVPDPVYGDWSETPERVPQGFMQPTYILNNAYRMSKEQLRDVRRAYYALITQIDYALGLLFARMRELGLLENTWIIFTSDHGEMLGDHHMGAKSVFFEGSAHVPMLIRPPHGSWEIHPLAGTVCDRLVTLADIMPTVLGIAGITGTEDLDGKNMLEIAAGAGDDRTFFGVYKDELFAVIEGDYKYLWTSLGGSELLFHLREDPYERRNLAGIPEEEPRLRAMRKMLTEHLAGIGSPLVRNGRLVHRPAPQGPKQTVKWPGFHSTAVETDVLH